MLLRHALMCSKHNKYGSEASTRSRASNIPRVLKLLEESNFIVKTHPVPRRNPPVLDKCVSFVLTPGHGVENGGRHASVPEVHTTRLDDVSDPY